MPDFEWTLTASHETSESLANPQRLLPGLTFGPDAAVAVPRLQMATTHPLFGTYATEALERIQPPVFRPLVERGGY